MRQLLSDIEKLGCGCHTRAPKPSVAAVTPGHPNQSLCPVCVGVQRRERDRTFFLKSTKKSGDVASATCYDFGVGNAI